MNERPSDKINIDLRYRTMLIIWLALMISVVMYLVTTQLIATPVDIPNNNVLGFALAGLGTFSAILSFAMRSKLLSKAVEKQDVSLVQTAVVLGCALCEVPALFGLMAKFTLPGKDYLLLMAISFVSMAFHFPRRNNLLAASYKTRRLEFPHR